MTGARPQGEEGSGPPRPAIQLHTLRMADEPLAATIERVADAGFEGVEFAGRFLETDPGPVERALEATGMIPVGANADLERLERELSDVVERCHAVGCRRVVVPHVGSSHFRTLAEIDALADRLTVLAGRLEDCGIELTYHNCREAFMPPVDQFGMRAVSGVPIPWDGWRRIADGLGTMNGFDEADVARRTAFGRIVEGTPETVTFELDVGWVVAAGYVPTAVMGLLGDRLVLIHVADVLVSRRFPRAYTSTRPGDGLVDLEAVVTAGRRMDVEWLVFEDDSAPDLSEAIREGLQAVTRGIETNR